MSSFTKTDMKRIWRLYIRGGICYTRAFPEWFKKPEVVERVTEDKNIELIDVEPVT